MLKFRSYRIKCNALDYQGCEDSASRFECYRNKAVVVEAPVTHPELTESNINSEPIISVPEPEFEIETTSNTTEGFSTPSCPEPNEDVAELPKEEATPFYHQQYIYRRIQSTNRI